MKKEIWSISKPFWCLIKGLFKGLTEVYKEANLSGLKIYVSNWKGIDCESRFLHFLCYDLFIQRKGKTWDLSKASSGTTLGSKWHSSYQESWGIRHVMFKLLRQEFVRRSIQGTDCIYKQGQNQSAFDHSIAELMTTCC